MLTTEICAHFSGRILLYRLLKRLVNRILFGHLGETVAECVDDELESIGYLELGED